LFFNMIESVVGVLPKPIKELLVASGYATLCAITELKEADIAVILGSGERDQTLLPGHVVTLRRAADIISKVGFEAMLQKSLIFQQPKKKTVLSQKNNTAENSSSSVPSVVVLQNMVVDWLCKKTTKKFKITDIIVEVNPLSSTVKCVECLQGKFLT
jgi:hypothetical protein